MSQEVSSQSADWIEQLKWDKDGLIPAIAQDQKTGRIVMFAWMNKASLQQTQATGKAVYWSRSRQKLWAKGEESGHSQIIKSICCDCDQDVLLLTIEQVGGIACHTGRESCFYHQLDKDKQWNITDKVLKDPKQIYK
ncbi:MAG: phosphoribosyl-AMP cyclohydrolase [Pseudomonadota bacterium]